jgi:hypothetical protein
VGEISKPTTYQQTWEVNMQTLKNQIKEFLDSNDSAPGAHCFVLQHIRGVGDSEFSAIYEQSEGHNDTQRNALVDSMTVEQLVELSASILEIANEKILELENQVV